MNYNRFGKFFITVYWTAFVFILTGYPMPDFGPGQLITIYDKIAHFLLFGILGYLVILSCKTYKSASLRFVYFLSLFISMSLAVASESMQMWIPGRTVSEFDLLAGASGIILAAAYSALMDYGSRPKLLMHVCCISCSAYSALALKKEFRVSLFFYNQNIFPEEEYYKRLAETKKIAKRFKMPLFVGKYNHSAWREMVRGREMDEERGERCRMCYEERLRETARLAARKDFDFFTTILTVSPHKDAGAILEIGKKLEKECGVKFFNRDFKKQDGYKNSVAVSREMGLYRQDYCGCEFSLRDRMNKTKNKI